MSDDSRCPDCSGRRGMRRMIHDGDTPRECTNDYHNQADNLVEFKLPEADVSNVNSQAETHTAEPAPIPLAEIGPAKCPYCGETNKPGKSSIRGSLTTMGPFKIMQISCANPECRKILGYFQPIEVALQSIGPPPPGMMGPVH